jgi:anti-sigma factor RsiW
MTPPTPPEPRAAALPDDPVLLVHAYVDGELDPATALAVERRIAADPALAAEQRRVEALRRAIAERLPRPSLPPELRGKVERAVGLARPARRPAWLALAASLLISAAAGSGATWLALAPAGRPAPDAALATHEALLSAHLRALMAPTPADVLSTDRHTVKPWFAGRVAEAPRVVDLAAEGFPLVGGRIDVVGTAPAPTLVYRRRQHVISLIALRAAGAADSAPTRATLNGFNLVGWTDRGVAYWAVSDVAAPDLLELARLFRAAE